MALLIAQPIRTVELWVKAGSLTAPVDLLRIDLPAGDDYMSIGLAPTGTVSVVLGSKSASVNMLTLSPINDNLWHQIAVTIDASLNATLYEAAFVADTAVSPADFDRSLSPTALITIGANGGTPEQNVSIANVAVYGKALSADRILAHFDTINGFVTDTSGSRIARYLGYAGLDSTEWNIDTGSAVNKYALDGKTAVDASRDMAATESGGAVFYTAPDGRMRFIDRRFRDSATPALTLDAQLDLDAEGGFEPSADDLTLVNDSTVTREGGTPQRFVDSASVDDFGTFTDSATVWTATDSDALRVAQYRAASQATPAYRLPAVAVDLITAETDLWAQVPLLEIGSRLRATGLPASQPRSQIDLTVEGWTETITDASHLVVFDASPAQDRFLLGTGRISPTSATLTADITNAATSLSITTAAGDVTFTTNPASYPFDIQVGEEQVTLTVPPSGASSPQVFTGITRAVNGTRASAQSAGASIFLAPDYRLTL